MPLCCLRDEALLYCHDDNITLGARVDADADERARRALSY